MYIDNKDHLLLIDENDSVIGSDEKMRVHQSGILHRAFSIFLFSNDGQKLLIQRRATAKYHSGGLWSNTCCSHPRAGEPILNTLVSRLNEELGILLQPKGIVSYPSENYNDSFVLTGKYRYFHAFGDVSENELDYIYVYLLNDVICPRPDPSEVEAWQWIDISTLVHWITNRPHEFTAWFLPAFDIANHFVSNIK